MMKINKLEIENVKRVKAVKVEPAANGLTIIGGNNNQGKTSVLDSIAWALGGDKYRPTQAQREGSVVAPYLKVVMSNGLVVERKGKNSDLKVLDPTGKKSGQQLLNEFVEQLAIDLPRFMEASDKEKADTLLKIIGVGDKLSELERQEKELYNSRHAIGQIADQKEKFAKEMPYYPDVPKDLISPSELIRQQQEILARNGENQRKRAMASRLETQCNLLAARIGRAEEELIKLREEFQTAQANLDIARKDTSDLIDESTSELENNIKNIDAINVKVRSNLDKEKAEEDAKQFRERYNTLSIEIDSVRLQKTELLKGADLPLPGLSVEDGKLTYHGFQWTNMSGSEQLKVATAIVRKLNPQCGFVLLDKLEQMDLNTLNEFGAWLESEGLQAIATRVSTGDECSIIIEDGYAVENEREVTPINGAKTWKEGVF